MHWEPTSITNHNALIIITLLYQIDVVQYLYNNLVDLQGIYQLVLFNHNKQNQPQEKWTAMYCVYCLQWLLCFENRVEQPRPSHDSISIQSAIISAENLLRTHKICKFQIGDIKFYNNLYNRVIVALYWYALTIFKSRFQLKILKHTFQCIMNIYVARGLQIALLCHISLVSKTWIRNSLIIRFYFIPFASGLQIATASLPDYSSSRTKQWLCNTTYVNELL